MAPKQLVALLTVGVGFALTVTVAVTAFTQPKPLVTVYDIVEEPADTPVTTPPALIVATAPLDELHTPPAVASDKVVVLPTHTVVVPVIAATTGSALTVTVAVTAVTQPAPLVTVYEIVEEPADTPVTTPPALIVATAPLDELHTPPAVASDKVVVLPAHTVVVPVIAATTG